MGKWVTEIPARMLLLCPSVIYMKCIFNSFSVLILKERVVFSQRLSFLLRALACCSGWLKLSEQSLLVCAPYPGGRPYPHCPLLAHLLIGQKATLLTGGAVTPQRTLDL